jgi:transcription antitermination factor NusG
MCVVKNLPGKDGEALYKTASPTPVPLRSQVSVGLSESQSPKWFAVYTFSRHEKSVAQHFRQRQIEHYLPLYQAERRWKNGSKGLLELPLFPGYLFVRLNRNLRARVLEVPGALSLVGSSNGQPIPLPDAEIEALRRGLSLCRAEPYPLLRVGQRVRICSGTLTGIEGIVVRMKNGFRFVLTMELIMRSISVEVDGADLEPVDSGILASA